MGLFKTLSIKYHIFITIIGKKLANVEQASFCSGKIRKVMIIMRSVKFVFKESKKLGQWAELIWEHWDYKLQVQGPFDGT